MAWQLEIHHIDVRMTGDATLIIAREVNLALGVVPRVRSVLIDGGRATQSTALNAYLVGQLGGGGKLNIIIVTHYQDDHVGGITRLLKYPNQRYDSVCIYDQGWPAGGDALEQNYINYVRAVNGLGTGGGHVIDFQTYCENRTRVTRRVRADGGAPTTGYTTDIGEPAVPDDIDDIDQDPDWLLAAGPAEILWDGVGGGAPQNAPTMRFIAANKYVRTPTDGITGPLGGAGGDQKNKKCLAVEVSFGNFRYYVAGDIETAQEAAIQQVLNNGDDAAGRVVAMKASHHGSNSATVRAFVDRLRPSAAFISCGTENGYGHPARETTNVLDGYLANPTDADPVPQHGAEMPPSRPVVHFLTGYQVTNPLQTGEGTAGYTAGDPNPFVPRGGDIILTVTEAQSGRDQRAAIYLGVQAAATAAATDLAVADRLDQATADLAAAGAADSALSSGAGPAAKDFLTIAGPDSIGAGDGTAAAANDAINAGDTPMAIAVTVTAAAMAAHAPHGPAAGAGAAAAAYAGSGTAQSIGIAVASALITTGVANATALAAGAAASAHAADPGGLFTVRFYRRASAANVTFTHNQ
jgi:hypothetical protein